VDYGDKKMADIKIEEAVMRALETAPSRNFKESVDIAINLKELDLRDPTNRVDETVILPKGTGKETRIVLFAVGENAVLAENVVEEVLGANEIKELGDDVEAAKALANSTDFFVADVGLMQDIAKLLGKVLGPRGKMPRPLQQDENVVDVVNRMKNTVQLRSRDNRTFHARVGTEDMSAPDIAANIEVIVRRLYASLKNGSMNVESIYVKTTMGPSERVV
tara:strand:- start:302 stop:961 length:660 start_codon:yes stop_codon:yes gene_type:complete